MPTKEPEILQPDAFCEHTLPQNATAAGTRPRTPVGGNLQRSPDSVARYKGAASRRGGKGREGREKRKEAGRERKGRGREFDSDAELEQGLRLAKAGVGPDRLLFAV